MSEELLGWGETSTPLEENFEDEIDIKKFRTQRNQRENKKGGAFQMMGLSKPVFKGVMKKGYKVPTPIQRKTLPLVLMGRDVVAMARTGSGKTACFLIPMFEKLQEHTAKTGARALILSPTRELALQTLKFTKELGCFMNLRAAVILGGDNMDGQFYAMNENPDILIATPGRLAHLIVEMNLKLKTVEYVVFDEADRLFEMGFAEQLNSIVKCLPEQRQTLLFSATLPKMLVEFARAGLADPVLIRLDVEHKLSENLKITFFKCKSEDKLALLLHILQHVIKKREQTIIFAATKHHVEYLHNALDLAKIPNTYCYSSLHAVARKINVAKFQTKKVQCLIVTDVAARGIDIPMLDSVINYHFPAKSKLFVHRVGRVARAGRSGTAYSFVAPDEAAYFMDLHLFLGKDVRFAPHPPDKNKRDDWDGIYGSVPQTVIDAELEQILNMHEKSSELGDMKNTMDSAYKQYSRSRPPPSKESIKRMKEDEWLMTVGYHPLLIKANVDLEDERLAMLERLKNLQPKETVFEMSKNRHDKQSVVYCNMKEKREYDENKIKSFHRDLEMRRMAKQEMEVSAQKAREDICKLQQSTEEEISDAFSSVVTSDENKKSKSTKDVNGVDRQDGDNVKRKGASGGEPKPKKKKKQNTDQDFKDKEFYIPYAHEGRHTEEGYSLQSGFHKDTDQATLDMLEDDDVNQRKKKALHKWNRYTKKFVSTQEKNKKIKTESGVWISASYKTGRYEKWLAKGKKKDSENDDGNRNSDRKRMGIKTINIRAHSTAHPLYNKLKGPAPRRPPKRELRTEQEIVKETARVEAERMKHKLGRERAAAKKKGKGIKGKRRR